MQGNSLVVIENGQLNIYCLDDKVKWEVGRPSNENIPDIKLHSTTVSRQHGCFKNTNGYWYYIDGLGKNGTVYKGKRIMPGLSGKAKPIGLNNGDVLIFGGGEEPVINSKTVWVLFVEKALEEKWRVEETKYLKRVIFTDGERTEEYVSPAKGTVVELENGIAIYMGNITYLIGNIWLK